MAEVLKPKTDDDGKLVAPGLTVSLKSGLSQHLGPEGIRADQVIDYLVDDVRNGGAYADLFELEGSEEAVAEATEGKHADAPADTAPGGSVTQRSRQRRSATSSEDDS